MKWQRLAVRDFDHIASEWDGLAEQDGSIAPFMRSRFMRPLLRHFSSGNETIVVGHDGSEVVAAAVLERKALGLWQTFQPSQLPLGAIVCKKGTDAGQIAHHLLAAPSGMTLAMGLTQLDPTLLSRPAASGRTEVLDYIETAWVDVQGSFDSYWEARGKNLRHNIRKQRSRLDEQGIAIRLETLTRPGDVAAVLHDYGTLESAGWKASLGTAIHPDNAQGRFYREMLEAYCDAGAGRLYRCWLGDRVAAIDLCISVAETLVILKTTYDESFQTYSPAFLMRNLMFADLFREGAIHRIEFYGKLMDWHKRWTDKSRTLYHLNAYRWQWLPKAKQLARRAKAPPPPATTAEPAGGPKGEG